MIQIRSYQNECANKANAHVQKRLFVNQTRLSEVCQELNRRGIRNIKMRLFETNVLCGCDCGNACLFETLYFCKKCELLVCKKCTNFKFPQFSKSKDKIWITSLKHFLFNLYILGER
ncbi:hypothetical protein RF11_02108 [Thelohanellus kitauei]|uniref:Uncharacterized protein n=1 Tax=Thelohanellus kitauei TaxID=669202 RepID=A0A0C2MXL9_THEKT|nr:hypothetical protein RF11_02108 [Thelohanellus kitauei]